MRVFGVDALGATGEDWALAGILRMVHDTDPEVAMAALDALTFPRKFQMERSDLLRLLRRPEPELRLRLIEYTDATGHPGRRDLLQRLLTDPSEEVRDRARLELEEEEDP